MNLTEPEVFARIKGTHVQLVRIEGTFVVVLDVSFRDDIRFFAPGSAQVRLIRTVSLNGLEAGS